MGTNHEDDGGTFPPGQVPGEMSPILLSAWEGGGAQMGEV